VLGDATEKTTKVITPKKWFPGRKMDGKPFEIFDKSDANAMTMFGKDAEGKGQGYIYPRALWKMHGCQNIDPATGHPRWPT